MISCIIVEDEPSSQNILKRYINDYPELKLLGICNNAYEAIEILNKQSIDLIFLDVNLPKLSGLSLLKSLNKAPLVVFTTAYSQYAVEGFNVDAVDFLLKPFSFERFLKAVQKVTEKLNSASNSTNAEYIMLQADKKMHKIYFNDIVFIEAKGDYMKIQCQHDALLVHKTMHEMESLLPKHRFIRIHKSHIISHQSIKYIEGNQVCVHDVLLPIGKTYRKRLMESINSKG